MDLFTRIAIMDQLQVLLDAFVASVLGGLIGWERDRAGKSAGPRTMALVATAASMVVSIGVIVDRNAALGDPTRAMHAVITGIGFESECEIRIHGVQTLFLQGVRLEFAEQPDTAAFVSTDIEHDAAATTCDGRECGIELGSAITAV